MRVTDIFRVTKAAVLSYPSSATWKWENSTSLEYPTRSIYPLKYPKLQSQLCWNFVLNLKIASFIIDKNLLKFH